MLKVYKNCREFFKANNLNRYTHFLFISDSQKTCIAKAVAKMIIEENDVVDNL